ncbi:MAG: DUF983 domain-containing protein [Phenylobacterium sp.]|uniref:DUF983 domain-containing protein n=1 Tax=Phenylobacterium sp. TaxID=1871053 RepID=UPI002733016E|nr:DUF983 domain-containing protein [Phenylobacterium sp.]MDP3175762.1 DUF983 domain-containing protein [Phenylobacterium sp.]
MIEMTGAPRSAALGLKRGLARRCPNCGEGQLFRGYLKVEPSCEACGHDTASYRADDGPAYFTILLVGHLVVAPLLCFSFIWTWPVGLVIALTFSLITAVTMTLLPLVKGGFIGVQWATQTPAAT